MMHSIARFALIAAVLLAVPASAEESDGTPSAAPKVVTVGVEIVGFHPVSDVKKHADSVADVQALIEAGKDYAAVEKVYTAGAGTHGKNLQSFSTKFAAKATMQDEPVAKELAGNVPAVQHNFTLVVLGIVLVSVLPVTYEIWQARKEP